MVPKLQSALFRMKLGMKEYSGVLILNSTIPFSNPVLRVIFFYGKLAPKLQSPLFEVKLSTNVYLLVLIPRFRIMFLK